MPKILNFRVIVEQDEDGVFVASVPAIPGCHTQGETYEETVKNIKEAIELCLDVAKDDRIYRAKVDWNDTNYCFFSSSGQNNRQGDSSINS